MREILFRAKWMHNKEWIEGYYCKISETTYAFAEDYDKYPVPVHHYILQENMTDWGLPNRFWQYEIDPETLCQYTGLKDKNGNRIWENDIVRTSKFGKDDGNGHNYAGFDVFVVKWDDGGFALFNKWRRFNLRTDEKSYEILGKVFDNPELLKGE